MVRLRTQGDVFKVLFVFVVSTLLIGFSIINPLGAEEKIYFPFLNHLDPVGEEMRNDLVISEVMSDPVGIEPGNEWIEIFNRSPSDIDLHRYRVGDSEIRGDLEGMYAFPEGAHISQGKTIVIANQSALFSGSFGFRPDFELSDSDPDVPELMKDRTWSGGVINLNNSGDEVLLLNPGDERVDAVSWGDSSFAFDPPAPKTGDGMSLERSPANADSNLANNWVISSEPNPGSVNLIINTSVPDTPTATQTACADLEVLISEVLYSPVLSAEPDGEWVEIYNAGDKDLNLVCLRLGDEETNGGPEGMMTFPLGSTLQPGLAIVISNHGDTFLDSYGFSPDFEIEETLDSVPNLVKDPSWSSGTISLSNTGDEIILLSVSGSQVDAVSWGGSDFAFQPPIPAVDPGHSIARQPADTDTDSADDWVELSIPQPGNVDFDPPFQSPTPTETSSPQPPSPTATITPTPTSTDTPEPTFDVVINEILADPDSENGDANNDGDVDDADDEFVEIINNSLTPLDISEWSLGDYLGIRHVFPDGSIIEPGCGLILFGGGSPSGAFGDMSVQVASTGSLGLNDNMEIVYLYDADLETITSVSYGEEGGDDQSITRDPDIFGIPPLRKHSLANGSNGSIFSPGTMVDGTIFSGCSE